MSVRLKPEDYGVAEKAAPDRKPVAITLPACFNDLAAERRWVGWSWEDRNGKLTKPPKIVRSGRVAGYAQNDQPETWTHLEDALAAFSSGQVDGIGFQLLNLRGLAAFDLDACRDPDTGTLAVWAAELVADLRTYAEVTPSGRGIRIIGRCAKDATHRHSRVVHPEGGEVEPYVNTTTGRYITFTGDRLPEAPDALADVTHFAERFDAWLAFWRLYPEARDLIRRGRTNDRSADFQSCVNTLAKRVERDTALAILELFPDGPAGKYEKRLAAELDRSWTKAAGSPNGAGRKSAEFTESAEFADPLKGGSANWPEPDPSVLSADRREPPAFPVEEFGLWADWIERAAEVKNAPLDYVALALLSAAGSLIGNTRWSSPWKGWAEPPILWAAIVGTPSSNKSPALDAIFDPLNAIQRKRQAGFEEAYAEWEKRKEVADARRQKWLKAGADPDEEPEDVGPAPALLRLWCSDATTEALASIVRDQWRGLLLHRDELSGWLGNLDKYGGGGDRAFFLEAYGGRAHRVERKKDPVPIAVDRLSVGVVGGIQPDRLSSLLLNGDDDGLLARFMIAWPNPVPLKRPTVDFDDDELEGAVKRFLSLSPAIDEDENPRPFFVRFSPTAQEALQAFRERCREWETEVDGLMLSHVGKFPGFVVRLSLVLTYLDWAAEAAGQDPHEITAGAVQRAARLVGDYLRPMAMRAYGDSAAPAEERGAHALARMVREERLDAFTSSEILGRRKKGLRTMKELGPVLDRLIQAGWLRCEKEETATKPRLTYRVNPAAHEL